MLMKDQNTSYQGPWFIFRGSLLFYQEHQADVPLGLILLEKCQVESCLGPQNPMPLPS